MFDENCIEYARGNEDIETIVDNLKRGVGVLAYHVVMGEGINQEVESLVQRLEDPSTKLGSWYEIFLQKVENETKLKRYIRELVEYFAEACVYDVREEQVERLMERANTAQGKEQKRNQTVALNRLYKEFPEEERGGILYRIEQLEQLLCILKKNMRGELQLEDMEALEKNVPNWKEQIQTMKSCLEQMESL